MMIGFLAQAFDEAVPEGATGMEAAKAIAAFLNAAGYAIVPKEPIPEMLAATLPNIGRHHDPLAERTAKEALFILENRTPKKYEIEIEEHHKGYGAALDLIGDWRSMIGAALAHT